MNSRGQFHKWEDPQVVLGVVISTFHKPGLRKQKAGGEGGKVMGKIMMDLQMFIAKFE